MRPTTQKNNARQRKTIAIVAVLAVATIALANAMRGQDLRPCVETPSG